MKTYFFGYTEANPSDPDVMVQNGLTHVGAWQDRIGALGNSGGSNVVTSGGRDTFDMGLDWLQDTATAPYDVAIILIFTHGTKRGLPIPKCTWEHLAAEVKAITAGTVLLFLNACHSAYGVDAVKTAFGGRRKAGRNVGVFASVDYAELSQGSSKGSPLADEGEARLLNHAVLSSMKTFSSNVKVRWAAKRMQRTPKQWVSATDLNRSIW